MSYTCQPLEEHYLKKLKQWFPTVVFSHEYNPGKYVMPEAYTNFIQGFLDFEVRKDDVWIIGYPRSGTTWLVETAWLLMNDLNFDQGRTVPRMQRAPNIEITGFQHDMWGYDEITLEYVHNLPSPRCIKIHAPYALLPKQIHTVKPKVNGIIAYVTLDLYTFLQILYTTRNPKDVWCSLYNYLATFFRMDAPFEEASKYFVKGKMPFGGFFDLCLPYWEKRHEPNVHIMAYEDRQANDKKALKGLAKFLGKSLTEEEIDKLCEYVSFDKMKENPYVNKEDVYEKMTPDKGVRKPFLRQGKSGDWKNYMSKEIAEMFDEWMKQNTAGTGLTFDCP